MRGRTNAGGNGNLAINGNIAQFKIEDGISVTAGDFVEYKTQISESTVTNSELILGMQTQIGENLAITQSNGQLLLLKMVNNQLKIIYSYNNHIVTGYDVLSDGTIAVKVSGEPYLVRLKIENEMLQYICAADGIPEDSGLRKNYAPFPVECNGKLYLVGIGVYDDSYYHIFYDQFDILDKTRITYENEGLNDKKIFQGPDLGGVVQMEHCLALGENIYVFATYTNTNTYRGGSLGYRIRINEDMSSEAESSTSNSAFTARNGKPISFFNKYILSVTIDEIVLHNANSKQISSYALKDFGFNMPSASIDRYVAISKIGNDRFALFYAASRSKEYFQTSVFKVNENIGDIEIEGNIFKPSFSDLQCSESGAIYLNGIINDTIYYSGKTRSYAVSYNPQSGILSDEVDTTLVKPYNGGASIGVAKQSGAGGQKIEVYIPKA